MNATQILTIVLASVPTSLVVLIGILLNNSRLNDTNARIADLSAGVNTRFDDMNTRIIELRSDMNMRFTSMDRRFDEMKDLWRSELHRVEEVLDARLKHIEER